MVVDDLEPGPDPRKVRDPRSRRPSAPARVDAVLRSYNEDRAFSIRRATEAEAIAVKTEITAAVYYLRKWEGYDIRVRPYVTEHFSIDGVEYTYRPKTRRAAAGWFAADGTGISEFSLKAKFEAAKPGEAAHYWKTNFWVHRPLEQGFRKMSDAQREAAHEASAEARGVTIKNPALPQRRRTVQARAD